MKPVDVLTSIEIDAPHAEVAAFAGDPDQAPNRTRMTLRNAGQPSGFASIFAPFMARSMRRANQKDLLNLKRILETRPTAQ